MKKFALVALAAALALPMVSVNVLAMDGAMAAPDAKMLKKMVKRGKKVAIKQCFACHDITENKQIRVGPPLWGVYDRAAGTVEGYQYSEAHLSKADSIVWDEATLDAYLQDPKALVPGNKMAYPVAGLPLMSEKQRKNVIEFIKTLK
ncbi:MAG: c-type cytochrome [Candidatus Thiodiazotropha sp. L084R]